MLCRRGLDFARHGCGGRQHHHHPPVVRARPCPPSHLVTLWPFSAVAIDRLKTNDSDIIKICPEPGSETSEGTTCAATEGLASNVSEPDFASWKLPTFGSAVYPVGINANQAGGGSGCANIKSPKGVVQATDAIAHAAKSHTKVNGRSRTPRPSLACPFRELAASLTFAVAAPADCRLMQSAGTTRAHV